MNPLRRDLLASLLALAFPCPSRGAERLYRIAHVVLNEPFPVGAPGVNHEANAPQGPFTQRLAERGFVVGKNLRFRQFGRRIGEVPDDGTWRKALVDEAVAWAPDIIFVVSNACAWHARHLASSVPIVFANVQDPVSSGLVSSLARPGET